MDKCGIMRRMLTLFDEIYCSVIAVVINTKRTQKAAIHKPYLFLNRMGMDIKMFCL